MSIGLTKITSLEDYRPPIITTVYSDDNREIAEFYKERRIVIPLSTMPQRLIEAFVAAEDARFFKHKGIDIFSVIRAFSKNFEAGAIVQGGSTITQQVAKSFFLTPEKSYKRKIKEAILAYRIDDEFSKEQILFLYLNQIYLGHGAYGVESAANNYFGKSSQELSLAECAVLAGLPQAPSRYSPFRSWNKAKARQIYVLNRMVAEGYITKTDAIEAINTELDIKSRRNCYIEKAQYYTEHVRRYIEKKYGGEMLYNQGLKIYTAINIEIQKIAEEEVEKALRDLDKRQGYRGPIKQLSLGDIESYANKLEASFEKESAIEGNIVEGIVIGIDNKRNAVIVRMGSGRGEIKIDNMTWARKPDSEIAYFESKVKKVSEVLDIGDVILVKAKTKLDEAFWGLVLEQTPKVQSALLCIEAETGHVKAMIGGRNFATSEFNRAIQSKRQPGAACKPIIYAAAIDKGYTTATLLIDSPVVFHDIERDFTWKPRNYGGKFYGPTLLRKALAKSRNVVSIKILKDIGIEYVIEYAKKLGIKSELSRNYSIALGSSGISIHPETTSSSLRLLVYFR